MSDRIQVDAKFPPKARGLFTPSRHKFIHGGRGGGKSWSVARALLIKAASQRLRILCGREVQKSIRESVHQLLRDQIEVLHLGAFYTVLETEIRGANGSLFSFSGLSDKTAESIKSFEGYDIVWLEEARSVTKRSWSILIPTIRKAGSEIWATYNPELETDPVHVMATKQVPPDSIVIEMSWRDNPDFPPVLEQERQHAKATMKHWEYAHIWEGECLPAVEGAIYADEVADARRRVIPMSADPLLRTHCIWDLGWNDAMSIVVVQRAASEVRVLDYLEDTRRTLDSYVRELREEHPRALWGRDWLPHDGFATRHQTGKPDSAVLVAMGRHVERVPNADVERGVRAVRQLFPRLWFNAANPRVERLLECLKRYRRNVPSSTGEPGAPRHDEYSHGADAVRYLALVADRLTNDEPVPEVEEEEDEYAGVFVG
jgi:phage terminase large subunit